MSWLTKVTDIAGAAENLLNKLDEKTGDAIHSARDAKTRVRRSSNASVQSTAISMPEHIVTEDIGGPTYSIPSKAQSEFTRRKDQPSSSTQPGAYAATASDSWAMVLNTKDSVSQREDDDTRSQRSVGGKSVSSVRGSEAPTGDLSSLKSQLWTKESQMSVLKAKLTECEKKFEKMSQNYYEMKAEKEMLEERLTNQKISTQESDSLQELKMARKKALEQRESAIEESNHLKRQIVGLEEEVQAMVEQLRLAKFNLNENKKEFDEYKTKAQKILNAKEKLVESLKSEQGIVSGNRPVHLLQAEVEEIKVERDMAKSDLESTQLQLYTLRSDVEELEAQIRDLQSQLSEAKRNHLDEKQTWESTIGLLNEKVECSRIESEFVKQEMKRQNDLNNEKLMEKDKELRRIAEQTRERMRQEMSNEDVDSNQLADLLLQKQTQLEDALRTNQVLNVRLERLQKANDRETTTITMDGTPSMHSSPSHPLLTNVNNPQARQALHVFDSTAFKFLSMLRNHPSARLFFVFYFILMHLWLFFILITYTPEVH